MTGKFSSYLELKSDTYKEHGILMGIETVPYIVIDGERCVLDEHILKMMKAVLDRMVDLGT